MVDPKIDKNRQNPQDTCSKIPGRVFSEVAEAPQAAATRRRASMGKAAEMSLVHATNQCLRCLYEGRHAPLVVYDMWCTIRYW